MSAPQHVFTQEEKDDLDWEPSDQTREERAARRFMIRFWQHIPIPESQDGQREWIELLAENLDVWDALRRLDADEEGYGEDW